MTTITNTTAPFGAISIHRGVSLFAKLVDQYREWNARRQTRAILSTLSADQLEDIGLTKAELHDTFLIRG
ncbi:MAG: DUF1127 domain-containing protein [Pseudomonadota bacterium]